MESNDKNVSKKLSKKKKIIIGISILLLVILAAMGMGYMYIRNEVYTKPEPIVEDDEITVEYEEQEGITNILLIGTDARDLNENARSDSIIIATIDSTNQKVKLTSIMRDTFVDIPGYGEQKINSALALGGPELLLKTIRQNFNLNLEQYVMVNFWGFETIIDSIGGIDMEVKDYEIEEINKFIGEYDDVKSSPLTEVGMQHLDGQQALAFARIRKVGNGSYERTERQRRVMSYVVDKLQDVNPIKYAGMMYELLPYVKTNIEPISILNYAYTVFKFETLNFEQLQIPVNTLTKDCIYRDKGWVLLIDKEQNGRMLNDFIYRDILPEQNTVDYASLKKIMDGYTKLDEEYKALFGEPEEIEKDQEEDNSKLPTKVEEDKDKDKDKDKVPPKVEGDEDKTPPEIEDDKDKIPPKDETDAGKTDLPVEKDKIR